MRLCGRLSGRAIKKMRKKAMHPPRAALRNDMAKTFGPHARAPAREETASFAQTLAAMNTLLSDPGSCMIGTPLSPSATRVMLLGAGELGKEVIIALQRLGVETIAVDRYANAPGHQVAHRAHVIDMTDAAALKRLIEQERPQIIVPEVEAIAT